MLIKGRIEAGLFLKWNKEGILKDGYSNEKKKKTTQTKKTVQSKPRRRGRKPKVKTAGTTNTKNNS